LRLTAASPLAGLRGVGPVRARALAAAGFRTVGDLLFHLPARYEDRSTLHPCAAAEPGEAATFRGRLTRMRRVRLRRRGLSLVRGVLDDGTAELPVLWFNRPYLANQVDEGAEYLLHGTVRLGRGGAPELLNPSCEKAAEAVHSGRVVAVYGGAGELGPALLRRLVARVLDELDPAREVPEPLPEEVRGRHGLPPLGEALAFLHAPPPGADAGVLNERDTAAHQRLVYGELLELQLALARLRERQVRRRQGFRYRVDDDVRRAAREVLPFRLTGAQKRVLREIVDDLAQPYPMLRLLQGDVGSGKTIVAALALVVALESGLQGAFMAPTELLAEQHFARLSQLLGGRWRLGLATASNPELPALRRALAAGEVDLAVGTHALIQQGVGFARLGLAVIDEQHRFGVLQRRVLQAKGERPDVLVMTATPIPRSLALTAYGDLALSVLDELPPGRRPVATEVVPRRRAAEVYRRLRAELLAGDGRAYVVCPLIEDSDAVDAASVEATAERVRRALAPLPCAVLHGRLDAGERDRVVGDFAAGRTRVLVATTVIEVGVDVPAATAMVIESGERFGLAQLHQLRGRVGRSRRPSRCVVLHGKLGDEARRRLEVFAATTDGFRIAEADLEIRGPGDLLGTRQSGLPALRAADLARHGRWLEVARRDAAELLPRLGEPAFAGLAERVERLVEERWLGYGGG
jgi:ATP-dependent DNA helicase RecG